MTTRSQPLSDPQALALWGRYHHDGARDPRQRLVMALSPLVKRVVSEEASRSPAPCELGELLSCGLDALSDSIEHYDPAHGASLAEFASTRIHAAVHGELHRRAPYGVALAA